jgi:AcrR family transcriptional regulator
MAENLGAKSSETRSQRARAHALSVASDLFYSSGVRAVGMEEIVATSGVAKTTIYRHFPTKDALIAAFLEKEDDEFWAQWNSVVGAYDLPIQKLDALCHWIGAFASRAGYRGCPQLNVAAEFADPDHPARQVARRHKAQMHNRLMALCEAADAENANLAAMQIALLFDGAFMNDGRLSAFDAPNLLKQAVHRILGMAK